MRVGKRGKRGKRGGKGEEGGGVCGRALAANLSLGDADGARVRPHLHASSSARVSIGLHLHKLA